MRCKSCGRRVRCPEHGSKFIVEDYDLLGLPFYHCSKCVEEYETCGGAIVHMHTFEAVAKAMELLALANMPEKDEKRCKT